MKPFGPRTWGHTGEAHVATPVGAICALCDEAITADDYGVFLQHLHGTPESPLHDDRPWHRECLMYSMLGKPTDERNTIRKSAKATARRLDQRSEILVVHSTATENHDAICGLAATSVSLKTCHAPDQDVLESYQRGCPDCIKTFAERGGKPVWRPAEE